ncbi:MAG: SMI1/KNR4 family protein [Cuspidothrix sp.]
MRAVFQEICQKLALLQTKEQIYYNAVFGSQKHKYYLNPCLTAAEIIAFEQRHQITLPEDYRNFLMYVGNGGAGPHYGLFPLEHSVREVQEKMIEVPEEYWHRLMLLRTRSKLTEDEYLEIQQIYQKRREFVENKLQKGEVNYDFLKDEFPLNNADASDAIYKRINVETDNYYFIEADYPLNGCFPINERGCGWMTVLVISGEQRGKIWVAGEGWLPEFNYKQSEQKDFLSWYMQWVDNAISSISKFEVK